jgi:predicted nucleic acid-binding Zn ribbon protein
MSNNSDFIRDSDEKPLGQLVEKIMRAYGLEKKMKEMDILKGWPEMMGIAVANRTTNLRINNRVLYISMDSAVMREELLNGKQIILQRVNDFAGERIIDDVWFQ